MVAEEPLSERRLRALYCKYIAKNVYRVSSAEYVPDIRRRGLDPGNDPFSTMRPKLEALYRLVLRLERAGRVITLDWKGMTPKGSFVVEVSRNDLDEPFIDFTPYWRDALKFRRQLKGGAITTNVRELCEAIRRMQPALSARDRALVDEMHAWAVRKQVFPNRVIIVKGSSKALESAKFQHRWQTHAKGETERYWESPYGSFAHFKAVVRKHGFARYEPFLKGEKTAHLRLIARVPASQTRIC